jgi:hypothetical protein
MELDFVLDTPKFEILVPWGPKTNLKSICLRIQPTEDDSLVLCGQEQGCIQLVDFTQGHVVKGGELDIRVLLIDEYSK